MNQPLRILHLEDEPHDSELMAATLRAEDGPPPGPVDVIISDTRQEVMGRLDTELLPPRLAEMYRTNDRQVMDSGMVMEFEEAFPWDDGLPRVFSSSKFPLRDTHGRPYALCGISTDITDRKRTEEAMKMAKREVLRRLWADPRTRQIPVAVLSADATSSQSRRLLAAGATACLTKPLDVTRLLALLDERVHS